MIFEPRKNSAPYLGILTASLAVCMCCPAVLAQDTAATTEPLSITKIDPPNWFASLPKPMLLVHGTGLRCATFSLSDPSLTVQRTEISTNGHWAQVYLSASPAAAESVALRATCPGSGPVEVPYTFAARRALNTGMNGFSPRDVIYLILTDRFADGDRHNDGPHAQDDAESAAALAQRLDSRGWHGGDLRGIEEHLEYLQQLGVTAVWTTPVYQNHSGTGYHGYHATDYYSVDEHFGTLSDLQSLAAALHKRGMKLILDTVPNHVGPKHPWVMDEPEPDWFHGTAADHLNSESNFDALVSPHAPARDRMATLDGWFANELPDMNTDNPAVALYLRQNAIWWIEETGADALRIDTFPYVDRPFWNEFNGELKMLYPELTEVGEISSGDPQITSAFAEGAVRNGVDTKLYTPFDFPFYYAARDVFGKGAPFSRIARVLEADQLYMHPERLVTFLSNHDNNRLASDLPDPAARQLAWALLFTTRGTPQLYAGNEIAMTGGEDPANRTDFPSGFYGDSKNAFSVNGRSPKQNEEFDWVEHLARLRQNYLPLACGEEQVLHTGNDVFAYARYGDSRCADIAKPPAAGSSSLAVLVVLERGALTELNLDLRGTALAACRSATILDGKGDTHLDSQHLTLLPKTSFVLLACSNQ